VGDDNAFAEAQFRTAKHRPEFPSRGFGTLDEARAWAAEFVPWYHVDHRHGSIRYVSPQQRHTRQDQPIPAARHALYLQARERNPAGWSGATRDWSSIDAVALAPERDQKIKVPTHANRALADDPGSHRPAL
jgi:putative transposase